MVFYMEMGITNNYSNMGQANTEKEVQIKAVRKETETTSLLSKAAGKPVNLSISDEGRNMLREMVSQFEPKPDCANVRELTIQNTNEVAWEHYTAMRDISSLTLKDRNYNVKDVIKSIMDTYETRYNETIKQHENGNREVSYELTGKKSLTLDEDLAGLDEAFKMRLANLAGYITCQQTNKAFENSDSSWYFHRNRPQNEAEKQDNVQLFDTLGVSQLSNNREEVINRIKHTVIQSATVFSDTRAGILKEIRETKGGYDNADVVNACGLTYAKLYSEIEERYENGNEQYYKLDGTPLTKQDEVDWLDKEYENEVTWQKACIKIKAQKKVSLGYIPEIPIKEIEEFGNSFEKSKEDYLKLYRENKHADS